jgi:cysteine desulfurase
MEIYLDNSATTKPYKDVVQAMTNCMVDYYGNPSSIHSLGEKAKKYLKECRKVIADTLKAEEEEIIFTSGGSESNNFLLKGFLKAGYHLITSCIEHSSILSSCCELEKNGVEVTYLKVDSTGKVSIRELKENIKANTKLVSIMHVNNEIGVIQDIEAIGTLIKEVNPNILFHVDAVQSYGKLSIDVNKFKIDLLSISAHKLHGPRGIGAAYIRKGYNPKVLINGGGQEFNLRSGTENLPAVAGFVEAAKIMNCNLGKNYAWVTKLRDYLVSKLGSIAGVKINSCIENSLPYVLNISATGIRSGKILFYLDERQIYVSKSSACSARKLKDSHVLKALGLKQEDIMGSLRISFSEENTLEQIDLLVQYIKECLQELRNRKIK